MKIISQIKIDEKWVNQELIPREEAVEIIVETICGAFGNVGYQVDEVKITA